MLIILIGRPPQREDREAFPLSTVVYVPWNNSTANPEMNCLQAHTCAWNSIVRFQEVCLCLEADYVVHPTYTRLSSSLYELEQWMSRVGSHMLYLGGQPLAGEPPRGVSRYSGMFGRTHAYILDPTGAEFLLSHRESMTLPWSLTSELQTPALGRAVLRPPLFGQAAGISSITGRRVAEQWWWGDTE